MQPVSVAVFAAVVLGTSLLAVAARRFRVGTDLPSLEDWALAGRQFGPVLTWFLLGGSIYTAYTFAAVPGLVYGAGALGFFALAYTVMMAPLAFVVLPRLWRVARDHGYLTVADYVRGRYDSPLLALAVALTGILATMPYIALQLLGIRALLSAGGVYPAGLAGDLMLTSVFAVLAGATYRSGLRAPTVISLAKGILVFAVVLAVVAVALGDLGGPAAMFDTATRTLSTDGPSTAALVLDPAMHTAYASLALGSAMALLMYPHVLTASFAAAGPDSLRRATIAIPAWTVVLGLFALLGVAAIAQGVVAPPGNAEAAVPVMVRDLLHPVLTGLVFGALAVGALVPAAVMSVAAAALFVRNVYVEYFNPTATPKHQTKAAQVVSLVAKFGAIAFVFGLPDQDAINLQLLGGVWILQTFPSVALGVFSTWLHRGALLTGWAVGMAAGTALVASGGFSAVVALDVGGRQALVYVALAALALNLTVAMVLTPILDRAGVARGMDATAATERRMPRPPKVVR
ncbi:sodium:solute symporter family protein [Micromonospora endolithica]|uniref:Sodium:solute symporter n=1 Tax=Micromonospora endolithica TaxID=230091 RepID=A0A3A9ZAF8_9ACTN|nr:sodium:solute symporter [Micromonospora endolithica]RKN45268.1 sodium:solute symporter [Micromonospora endolithica]TWJ23046.1 SSS family solute:Na+ symporter [Micromonospora endolithica]